jgi:uncharacterized membrane protein
MNIYVAASLFSLIILIYWVMSEFFTMLFRFIGLPEEKARFQVTSLLTGVGFTTRESEMILSTKSRRRLARVTMLFGYVFNISIVTALINMFLSLKGTQFVGRFVGFLIPIAVAAVAIMLIRLDPVRRFIDKAITSLAGSFMKRSAENTVVLIDHIGKGAIAQVEIKMLPEELEGVTLANSGLKEKENILIMLVEHKGKKIEAPAAATEFAAGDRLTVFGEYKTICRVFHASERFD